MDTSDRSVSRRDVIRLAGGTALAGLVATPGSAVAAPGQLEIRDGTPWWLSTDVWVVPGDDPKGPMGQPVAGGTAYVWARVTNRTREDVFGAQVRFYWGNPSTQMFFSTINPIGSAFADVPAGGSQDVLCLTPWNVVSVNNGHECLVAVVSLPDDPPLPDVVDPPAFLAVAQRNLTVLTGVREGQMVEVLITLTAGARDKEVLITCTVGGELTEPAATSLGLRGYRPADGQSVTAGVSKLPGKLKPATLVLKRGKNTSMEFWLGVTGVSSPGMSRYQLVHVTETENGVLLGGITFVVVGA